MKLNGQVGRRVAGFGSRVALHQQGVSGGWPFGRVGTLQVCRFVLGSTSVGGNGSRAVDCGWRWRDLSRTPDHRGSRLRGVTGGTGLTSPGGTDAIAGNPRRELRFRRATSFPVRVEGCGNPGSRLCHDCRAAVVALALAGRRSGRRNRCGRGGLGAPLRGVGLRAHPVVRGGHSRCGSKGRVRVASVVARSGPSSVPRSKWSLRTRSSSSSGAAREFLSST